MQVIGIYIVNKSIVWYEQGYLPGSWFYNFIFIEVQFIKVIAYWIKHGSWTQIVTSSIYSVI